MIGLDFHPTTFLKISREEGSPKNSSQKKTITDEATSPSSNEGVIKVITPSSGHLSRAEKTALLEFIDLIYTLIYLKEDFASGPIEKTRSKIMLEAGKEVKVQSYTANFFAPRTVAATLVHQAISQQLANTSYTFESKGKKMEIEVTGFSIRIGETTEVDNPYGNHQTEITLIPLEITISEADLPE